MHLGDIGALAFTVPAWWLAARDAYIGWDEQRRRCHLERVLCNSRFLIRPQLRVPNLASQVLRQLPGGWAAQHGRMPALVETFELVQWRGLQRLDDITVMYREMLQMLFTSRSPP